MMKHRTDLKQASDLVKWAISEADGYKVIADYGAGTGTAASELANTAGKILLRYDPFLPDEVNDQFYDDIGTADVLTCANVLNVLTDDQELANAVRKILDLAGRTKTGTAFVSVYKAPAPSATQRAQPLSFYFDLFRKAARPDTFVDCHGGLIWITRGVTHEPRPE